MTRAHAHDASAGRMTATAAARWIGTGSDGLPVVSARTVLEAVRRGQLRACRVGGRVLITPIDLDAWLTSREINPNNETDGAR